MSNGFIEVETPILQTTFGGADAKPFKAYHNFLKSEVFLRISPELYLKRLIVGGFEKIFEIGKCFRNEGVSPLHHAEFSMVEFYAAYFEYKSFMIFIEKLIQYLCFTFFKKYEFYYNNILLDLSGSFKKSDFLDLIVEFTGISYLNLTNRFYLYKKLSIFNVDFLNELSIFELQFKLFEFIVEKQLVQPTFVLHHPVLVSPLSKHIDERNAFVERFELYIAGKEIANGFSELNDPIEQLHRFNFQLKKNTDLEKCVDFDFINALRYGLPPTSGAGIGIDRLVMLFLNISSIKDIISFPLMKN